MPMLPDGTEVPYPDDPGFGGDPFASAAEPEQLGFDERLSRIISDARAAIDEDGVDEQERLLFEQLTTLVQKIRATREKEHQAALGGGPATNFLRRAAGGSQ